MIWLIIAILALLTGHIVKVYRWRLFIDIYEHPSINVLLKSLSVAHAINFLIPFHIGDLYRIWYSGKKMTNGIKFSLATIIVEHYIDLIVLAFICIALYIIGHNTIGTMVFISTIAATFVLLAIVAMRWDNKTKYIVVKIAEIFNPQIELRLLGFVWTFVTIFKHLIHTISKARVLLSTITMWLLYIGSYWCLAEAFQESELEIRLRDIIDIIFNKSSVLKVEYLNSTLMVSYLSAYVLIPLFGILVISYIRKEKNQEPVQLSNSVIPHVNAHDALLFLETFFRGNLSGAYLQGFMEVNKDVNILEDYSAGSNAVTLLCTNGKDIFYRKFAIGEDGKKLFKQIEWLKAHETQIPLPKILGIKKEGAYCSYDMEFNEGTKNFFTYIHTHSSDEAWSVLNRVISALNSGLYHFDKTATQPMIEEYISQKVIKNLNKIKRSSLLTDLLRYDNVIINGVTYKNLKYYEPLFEQEYLKNIFTASPICDIHGDLTIENIICSSNDYYLIDPNTGNVLECPWLDFGKLFQSLHGGYEFLMRIQNVSVVDNHIDFAYIRSAAYDELFCHLKEYILAEYGADVLTQIYYHEIIHWLRLMPYKLNHIGERSLLFFAGLIMVLNDFDKCQL